MPLDDHSHEPGNTVQKLPKLGQMVQFTGTFLKIVRFAAGDGTRLAPLIVGDQPPVRVRDVAKANGSRSTSTNDPGSWSAESPGSWLLGLTLALRNGWSTRQEAFPRFSRGADRASEPAQEGDQLCWVVIRHWNSSSRGRIFHETR